MTSKPGPAAWLATVCERVLRDFKYELPGQGITHLNVNGSLVKSPEAGCGG
jgi:hypothetical protein